VNDKIGVDYVLPLLALVLLALSVAGAYELADDDEAVALIAIAQVPVYAAAAALIVFRQRAVVFDTGRALALILAVGFLMRLIVVVAPPASSDIYRYIWDGRVQAAGINPYRYLPVDPALQHLRDDTIYPLINRADYAPTIYPPLAQIVYLAATRISESVTFMKLVMVAFEGLAVWAMLQLLAARGLPSSRILLYLWHPLPLWAFAGDGHIDAAAIAFLLLAFVAIDRRSPVLAGIALASGALIKYFPIVAGPALYRRWDWRLPAAFGATAAVLYLPYLGVGAKVFGFLGGYVAEEGFGGGEGIFLWQLLGNILPLPSDAFAFYFPIAASIMGVIALVVTLRTPSKLANIAGAVALGVAFLVLLSPHYPWYFAWIIPFLCIYPLVGVAYLTCAALYINLGNWPPSLVDDLIIYGPALVLLAAEALARHHAKREALRGSAVTA
jgi:alpha-1,6-mannosyltransferase